MMKVKICGITNPEDAKLAVDLGADLLGFIFYKKSKRYIQPESAKEIIKLIPSHIEKVGIFVDEKAGTLNRIVETAGLTIAQIHGNEDQNFINEIRVPVIKGIRIKNDFDFGTLKKFSNCTFLLDSYSENEYGGTGKSFDWEVIPLNLRSNIFLAGGVSAENIEYIYNFIKPKAVDLSSSVETSPGIKDRNKMKLFFEKINKLRNK